MSIKNSIKKSIDFGLPELWRLQSSFPFKVLLRKALISDLQSSTIKRFICMKNSIQKSIDFGLPELWRLQSSFPLRVLLRNVLISDVQSSRGSTARFRTSRALEAPELISIKSSIKKRIDFGPPELWRLQSSFLLRVSLRKWLISDLQSSGGSRVHLH